MIFFFHGNNQIFVTQNCLERNNNNINHLQILIFFILLMDLFSLTMYIHILNVDVHYKLRGYI